MKKNDYGGGTTARSTRLIHGGLRYLETLDFRLVRMDLLEREILMRIAGHLVTLPAVIDWMAEELNWSELRKKEEFEIHMRWIEHTRVNGVLKLPDSG